MLNQLRDIATGLIGCSEEAEISVNKSHLGFLRQNDVDLKGVGIGNGGKMVKVLDFIAAVKQLNPDDPLKAVEVKTEVPSMFEDLDFLSTQAKKSLKDLGIVDKPTLRAFVDADEDLSTLKGIGDSTALKLIDLLS